MDGPPAGEPADDFAPRVEAAFWLHSRRYGSRRVTAEVQDELKAEGNGEWIGRRRVQRLMRELELVAIQPRRFVPRTTDSRHGQQMSLSFAKTSSAFSLNNLGKPDITC